MLWTPHGIRNINRRKRGPCNESVSKSRDILRQAIKDSGLTPGIYKEPRELDYDVLNYVHSHLCEILEDEIARFDFESVCTQLYEIHENLMARREVNVGWDAIGLMGSIRSLIELAVKQCDESETHLDQEGLDYLWAVASLAIGWDHIWDQFYSGLFKQEVVIGPDYEFKPSVPGWYAKALREHAREIGAQRRNQEIHKDQGLVLPNGGYFHREFLSLWLKNENPYFLDLDSCLSSEVGYSLVDFLLFRNASVKLAIDAEPDIVAASTQIVSDRIGSLGLEESTIAAILKDFALSKEVVCDVPSTKMFSTGSRNRDSRLLRRPIVSVASSRPTKLLFGYAALSEALDLVCRRIKFGSFPVSRWQEHTEVKQVFGNIQGSIGDVLKNPIVEDCKKVSGIDHVVPEKNSISGVKSDPDLGRIDIFLVDSACQRFILVEVKNSGNKAGTPLSMTGEYKKFLDVFLPTLRRKAEFFSSNIDELKREFGIPADEEYTVEGVIVVNQPRLWVTMMERRLPILDDREFFARLGARQDLLSNPNGIED